jgi:hypothetical protein
MDEWMNATSGIMCLLDEGLELQNGIYQTPCYKMNEVLAGQEWCATCLSPAHRFHRMQLLPCNHLLER